MKIYEIFEGVPDGYRPGAIDNPRNTETKPTAADVKRVLRSRKSDTFDNTKITAL